PSRPPSTSAGRLPSTARSTCTSATSAKSSRATARGSTPSAAWVTCSAPGRGTLSSDAVAVRPDLPLVRGDGPALARRVPGNVVDVPASLQSVARRVERRAAAARTGGTDLRGRGEPPARGVPGPAGDAAQDGVSPGRLDGARPGLRRGPPAATGRGGIASVA